MSNRSYHEQKKTIRLSVLFAAMINFVIGGVLVKLSIDGISILGVVNGALIPLLTLILFSRYLRYENKPIYRSREFLNISMQPALITTLFLILGNLLLLVFLQSYQEVSQFNWSTLSIVLLIQSIFIIPNVLLSLLFYLWMTRKFCSV